MNSSQQSLILQINHIRKLQRISVKGKSVVKPIESFTELRSDYNVSEKLMTNIEKAGYATPTPIQMQAIPAMIEGKLSYSIGFFLTNSMVDLHRVKF